MEGFKKNSYGHSFSRLELFVIFLAIIFVVLVVFPKVRGMVLKIKLNSAIDSAYSYKESVNNYYVSQLLVDNDFKLDGIYTITDGKLVASDSTYNIMMAGNVPSDGYLDYENNFLKDGCIVIGKYSVTVIDGNVVSASKESCKLVDDVDVALNM